MSGFGGFTPEAYQQLQEAYNQQLSQADEVEKAGVKVGSETLGVETAPFKADWLDKTGLWKYPDGKGDYLDARQTQENLLTALQTTEESEDEDDEEIDFDSLTDEELLEAIDSILSEDEDENDEDSPLNVLNEDEEIDGVSDEEIDSLINELSPESDSEEEDLDLDELEALVSEILGEEVVEETEDDDVISISDKIAALKEELAMLSAGVEEEEPTEVDSEEDPIEEEEEEVTSDDESA